MKIYTQRVRLDVGSTGGRETTPGTPQFTLANLAKQAKKVAEVNAITAMHPKLEQKKGPPRARLYWQRISIAGAQRREALSPLFS